MHVDQLLREILRLSLAFKDSHAFAAEPIPNLAAAAPTTRPRDGSSGKPKERLLKLKSGYTLRDLGDTRQRARSSVANDRRNIKTVSVLFVEARALCFTTKRLSSCCWWGSMSKLTANCFPSVHHCTHPRTRTRRLVD